MATSQVNVRMVDVEQAADVESVVALWAQSRPAHRVSARVDVRRQWRVALSREGVLAFIAKSDGRDTGFLVLSRGVLLPLMEESTVSIEHLYVTQDARRQGVGRALIARATIYADQCGIGQISTNVLVSSREGQRFFARLGFSPFVVRRVVSVAALRRRLVPEPGLAHDPTVQRRRSLRARSRAIAVRARTIV